MNRNRTSSLALLLMLSLAGCINLPDIDPEEPDTPDEEEPLPDLSVHLQSPHEKTYTNGAVDVSVEVTNGTPEAVDLFAGDELLATLTGPYSYHWNTTTKPEGSYTLTAKARRGTQSFSSEAREVVVDRTPPQVTFRTPSPGAQDVSVRQPIRVTFSEPIDPASLSDTTVHLVLELAGTPVELAKTLSLSADSKELTIAPSSKPNVPSEVAVSLDGVTDRAGNLLASPSDWNWRHPAWLPVGGPLSAVPEPQDTTMPSTRAQSPALALDAEGNAMVAWSEQAPTGTNYARTLVFVQRWNGGNWEPLGESVLGDSSVPLAGPASLEVDGSNRPVVALYNSTGIFVFIARWEGQWQEIGRLTNGDGGGIASKPSLQFEGAGGPVVAWSQADGSGGNYPPPTPNSYIARWSGTEWNQIGLFNAYPALGTDAADVVLKTQGSDQKAVAWSEWDGSTSDIHVSRFSEQGWNPVGGALSAKSGTTFAQRPSLQLDSGGNPVVAWKERNEGGTSSNIYVQRWTGALWESFGNGVNEEASIGQADDPALVLDASGNPIVAWAGTDGSTTNIYVHRWVNGHWELLGDVLSANPGQTGAAHPALRIDNEGVPIVAWDEADGPINKQTRNVHMYRLNR
jgi:Bacterial Ig-like domain/Bacterial Ig domain